jgi:hypothetical protein
MSDVLSHPLTIADDSTNALSVPIASGRKKKTSAASLYQTRQATKLRDVLLGTNPLAYRIKS